MRRPSVMGSASRVVVCCILALVLTAGVVSAAPRQQTTVNICSRTAEVQTATLARLTPTPTCSTVTDEQLAGITHLSITGYSAASIASGDFAGLTGLTFLEIRDSTTLTTANAFSQVAGTLEHLVLVENEFSSLDADVFDGLSALRELNLSRNRLSSLDEDVFDGLSALENLSVGDNELSSLDADVFDGLSALEIVDAARNGLSSLDVDIFDGLSSLEYLNVQGNELSSLPADIFDGLSALRDLNLSKNRLSSLDEDVFDGLSALQYLDLWSNELSSLDADIFDGLSALGRLGLSSNELSSLDADIFDGLSRISKLNLSSNELSSLDADVFDGLSRMWELNLRDNPIPSFPTGIFEDQTELRSLYLHCTSLTELDLDLFDPFAGTLRTLDIRGIEFTTEPSETAIRAKLTSLTSLKTGAFTCSSVAPGVTVTPGSLTVAEGGTGTYEVALPTQPTGNVTVAIRSDNTEVTVSPASLTFTDTTWDAAQTVTVSAARDTDTVDDVVTLTHDPSGADYASVSDTTLTVTVEDDDLQPVTVSFGAATYAVAEGGSVTVTVELSADPERGVTIPITGSNRDGASNADYSGVPADVTFNSGDTSETFTFTATHDTVDDDGESVRLAFVRLPAGVSAGTPSTSTVSIADDDDPAVTVSFGAATYTAAEGSGVTVTVTLNADPEREVTIPLTKNNRDGASDGDYSGVPANVMFGATERSKTFTFTATQDTVDEDGESVLLEFGSLPARVTAGSTATSTVSISDDPKARYDLNGNGDIEKNEMVAALDDYLHRVIDKRLMILVLDCYISGS